MATQRGFAKDQSPGQWALRIGLLAAAVSLAAYIPFKYATQLHAMEGAYAFLFPLSSLLALAGIILAVRPRCACDCGVAVRSSLGALAVLWLATGLLCVRTLTLGILDNPLGGSFAMLHMLVQHVFLSLTVLAFALRPIRAATLLGDEARPTRADGAHGLARG